jgi:hypothetical protein
VALDQISQLLYNRVPGTVIGYTPGNACEPIGDLTESRPVLEWIGMAEPDLIARRYDGFIDVESNDTNKSARTLKMLGIENVMAGRDLVFAGALEEGEERTAACSDAYGWHGNKPNASYTISTIDANITTLDSGSANDNDLPEIVYEKYYLTDSAYAVTRSENVDLSAACIDQNLSGLLSSDDNDTLLLFYGYRPWAGETFCADVTGNQKKGSVTILTQNAAGFEAEAINGVIRLKLDLEKKVRGSTAVHITKQKAVF